jgi:hypothetical protein
MKTFRIRFCCNTSVNGRIDTTSSDTTIPHDFSGHYNVLNAALEVTLQRIKQVQPRGMFGMNDHGYPTEPYYRLGEIHIEGCSTVIMNTIQHLIRQPITIKHYIDKSLYHQLDRCYKLFQKLSYYCPSEQNVYSIDTIDQKENIVAEGKVKFGSKC